jgi:hypothetical protein
LGKWSELEPNWSRSQSRKFCQAGAGAAQKFNCSATLSKTITASYVSHSIFYRTSLNKKKSGEKIALTHMITFACLKKKLTWYIVG